MATISETEKDKLTETAKELVIKGKGILAADESIAELNSYLHSIDTCINVDNQCYYRSIIFSSEQIRNYLSGIVIADEFYNQENKIDMSTMEELKALKIPLGIRVDKGTVPLRSSNSEYTTQGLDDLRTRLGQYEKDGIQFAKWHCVYRLSEHTPSYQALLENANTLARFASICQMQGMVPIVFPEVLTEGDHNIEQAQQATEKILSFLFKALMDHNVLLECVLLMLNVVAPGISYPWECSCMSIGQCTMQALLRTVPPAVAGILFTAADATEKETLKRLNEISRLRGKKSWPLTFYYSHALHNPVIKIWQAKAENVQAAQEELYKYLNACAMATRGKYNSDLLSDILSKRRF